MKYQVANFSRILATLLQGGLPLVPAMETAAESLSSRQMLNGVNAAAERVKEGQSLAHSLETQKLFPDLAVEMLEVGESTGALPAMLASVAEFYEEDVQTALGAAMALIEPLILISHGGVCGRDTDFSLYADLYFGSEHTLSARFQSFKVSRIQKPKANRILQLCNFETLKL